MTTALIVDDSDLFRSRARRIVEAAGLDVVGEAATAARGREEARRLAPDLVLLDIQLPDQDGIELSHELAAHSDVVLISSRDAAAYGARLAQAPAVAFIYKPDLSPRRLLNILDDRPR